ncbi:hypothetical protein [Bacillus phage BM-P1]|nr:hypothetical protein [Bacillus phage BM-P1]
MEEVLPGDIVFYRPLTLLGRIVSKVTKSEYSHVALVVGTNTVIEADKFIKTGFSVLNYDKKVHSIYRLDNISPEDRLKIVNAVLTMQDTSYDYSQIFGLFLRLVFRINTDIFNKANKFICSEIIDRAFISAGIPRKDQKNRGDVTPQELFEKYKLNRVV